MRDHTMWPYVSIALKLTVASVIMSSGYIALHEYYAHGYTLYYSFNLVVGFVIFILSVRMAYICGIEDATKQLNRMAGDA